MDLSAEFDTCVRGKQGAWALRQLEAHGISFRTIMDSGGLGAAMVSVNHGLWSFDPAGKAMVVLPVLNEFQDEPLIEDLVAFRPDEPEQWYLRQGSYGAVLGAMHLLEAECYQEPLRVHPTPLAWLQDGGRGVCPLTDVGSVLRGQFRLICISVGHGETLEKALRSRMPSIAVVNHG